MPMISQLPPAAPTSAADLLPISQSGTTGAVSLGNLLATTQPAILAPTGSLLGRHSLGAGGPEAVAVGGGLSFNTGTLAALGITGAAATGTIAATDLVGISQNGTDHAIAYASFLDGLTIDLAQPAAPASNSDTFWVAQGSSTMLRQSFSAVWAWIATQVPGYKRPVVELSVNTTLDGIVHNGRILVCSLPITLAPAFVNMGSGFSCQIVNLSGGVVTLGAGITTSTGSPSLLPGQYAEIVGVTYSGGNVIYAGVSSSVITAPGTVTGLTAAGATSSSMGLSWVAPGTGGIPTSYTVQYRVTGVTAWSVAGNAVIATSFVVSGLNPATSYDFEVFGVNAGGTGSPSASVTAATLAAPGSVTSITWNVAPSGSYTHGGGNIGVNAHVSPSTSAVQFGLSASATTPPTTWVAASYVNTDLWGAYVPIPATAGTWYAWCEGTDGSAPTVFPTAFAVI